MSENRTTLTHKMSWLEATRNFILNKEETRRLHKMAAKTAAVARMVAIGGAPVAFLDNLALVVPGVGLLSAADDVLVAYAIFACVRIAMIRHAANRSIVAREQ